MSLLSASTTNLGSSFHSLMVLGKNEFLYTLDCQKSMETCSLIFWEMCTETLLFGSNTVMDFSTNIKTEIKGKD